MRPNVLAFALLAGASAAMAAEEGDPARGKTIAEGECARCHDVGAGGAFKTMPPSFASIAAFRAPEEIEGRIWFPAMHSRMPPMYFTLEPQDVRDVVAYILTLEAPPP